MPNYVYLLQRAIRHEQYLVLPKAKFSYTNKLILTKAKYKGEDTEGVKELSQLHSFLPFVFFVADDIVV